MRKFVAKTQEGHGLKILAELFNQNLKEALFELSQDGIRLQNQDSTEKILFDLNLDQSKFQNFIYEFEEPTHLIGLNLKHLHDMLKNVKKRDTVELSIDDSSLTTLNIQIIPKEMTPVTQCSITIIQSQRTEFDETPQTPTRGILIQSNEFKNMCKSFSKVSSTIFIEAKKRSIKFSCSVDNLITRSSEFGDTGDLATLDKDCVYSEKFEIEQILKISKMSSLSKTLQVHTTMNQPIMFKSDVGSIGTLKVYIISASE